MSNAESCHFHFLNHVKVQTLRNTIHCVGGFIIIVDLISVLCYPKAFCHWIPWASVQPLKEWECVTSFPRLTQTFHSYGLLTTGDINKNTNPSHSSKSCLHRFSRASVVAKCTLRLKKVFCQGSCCAGASSNCDLANFAVGLHSPWF